MILDKFQLTGKVAIVTGASRGLGQGMAVGLAEAGADIVLVARTKAALEKTAAAIQKVGRKAVVIPADLSSGAAEAERVVQETVKGLGHVDILLNVAGTQVRKPFFEMTEQDYEYLMSVNLKALFFISQAASKEMAKQSKGKIINITSLTSFIGISNISLYTASKGAVASLTRQFAVELAKHNIQCNAIGPGYFRTELTEALFQDPEKAKWVLSKIPMGRTGVPEDLVGAAVFLASAASDYITGQIVNVDGGWLSA
ncbi:MAG: 2-dehydro-3-deoxy-D-gluconate 5-dehydrogenase [Syntrophaceae bacterium PtaU1.Bin231]|nr:MAG: 2-dehydro-3-deoxy-D-gluconate 5-dehydrogenase [Syntrophaceae bacterium PtaU1.Bin231]HOG18458.1 glucose 1-dehydrogenase [Syntrophales bacterium]